MPTMTYEIPVENLGAVLHQIDAIRKRARKVGVAFTEPTVDEARWCRMARKGTQSPAQIRRNVWTAITFEVQDAPRFEGWRLTGVVEAMGDEAIVREVPGETVAAEYRAHPFRCEHCGTDRIRRETFVLANEDGRRVQVGRSCLGDFLGGRSVEEIVRFAQYLADLDLAAEADEIDWPHIERGAFVEDVLAAAVRVIRRDGMYRKAGGYGETTRSTVSTLFYPARDGKQAERDAETIAKYGEPSAEDAAEALKIAEWLRTLTATDGSYLGNLGVIARAKYAPIAQWGLLVSAPVAYRREVERVEREEKKAIEKALAAPVPVGKVEVEGVVINVREVDGNFGTQWKMTIKGDGGWRIWTTVPAAIVPEWRDGEQQEGVREGDRVAFVATVNPADDDDTMGFAKRPTKARIVARAEGE